MQKGDLVLVMRKGLLTSALQMALTSLSLLDHIYLFSSSYSTSCFG